MIRARTFKGAVTVLLLSIATGVLAETTIPKLDRVMVKDSPKEIGDFELTDQNGKAFRFSQLRGKPTLVFFGFAHCPEICPTVLSQIQTLKASSPKEFRDLQVVFVSIDGERDTPAAVKEYLAQFSPEFVGLTGPPANVNGVASRFAAAFFKGQQKSTGEYDMQHTSQTYVIDRGNRLRAEFYGADVNTMKQVVRVVLAERAPAPR